MFGSFTVSILSDGKDINSEYNLISIDIIEDVNKIPTAELILLDGDAAKQEFKISNTDFFEPGKKIEIQLYYDDRTQEKVTFIGIVIRHQIKASLAGSFLIIEMKDAAFALTTQRKNAIFKDLSDSKIIQNILSQYSMLKASVAAINYQHKEMVQYYCTDWDFILSRADANGYWVLVNEGKVTVKEPTLSLASKATFEYGTDIIDCEMEVDIRQQFNFADSIAWDVKNLKLLQGTKVKKSKLSLKQGEYKNLTRYDFKSMLGAETCTLIHPVDLERDEIKAWTEAKILKSRLSLLRGRLTVFGNSKLKLGDTIEIKGIGDRFNGKTLVTGIRHQLSEGSWLTDVQFGLSADWFSQNNNILDTPAAGLVPAIQGLQIGIVVGLDKDPQKQYRIQVKVPAMEDNLIWARLATLYANKDLGIYLRPEINAEVILGFLNNDPRQAVILGSLHSEKNAPPYADKVNKENNFKVIKTREHEILFDDGEKEIKITSKNKNSIILSEKGIKLEDPNKNTIESNDSGFVIKSNKDIKIEGKNITIKGSKIDIN